MPKRNLAARAGHWSARHRKIAIGGWLAFVVIAFVLGGAIGTKELADEDTGNGSSRVADTAITNADFPDKADEQVLIQARGGKATVDDPAFKPRRRRRRHGPQGRAPHRRGRSRRSPTATRARSPRTAAPRSSRSRSRATATQAETRVDASLSATAAAQKAHPDLRIEQFGDASADKALGA